MSAMDVKAVDSLIARRVTAEFELNLSCANSRPSAVCCYARCYLMQRENALCAKHDGF